VHCIVAGQESNHVSSGVSAKRWIRALDIPLASHKKMASAGVLGACSPCKETAANNNKTDLRIQRFTKPPAV
jgi:hypothetical protein